MPAPPYFSGKITPRNPISASLGIISAGNLETSSHSITWGRISASANSRTVRRNCFCSSLSENSKSPRYKLRIYVTVGFVYTMKARTSTLGFCGICLPAFFGAVFLVLLVEPGFQRCEILEHGGGFHLSLAGERFESIRPRAAFSHFEHLRKFRAGFFVVVNGAAIEWSRVTGR